MADEFRTGSGVVWNNHRACLFCGVAEFFRPSYQASLFQEWMPSLIDIQAKPEAGVSIADVGGAHGAERLFWLRVTRNRTTLV